MKLLQRFDHQKIGGKPDGPAPVGIPAEYAALGFSGLVVHPVLAAVDREDVRVRRVKLRKRANAVRREKFFFIDHVAQDAHQLLAVDQREQPRGPFGEVWVLVHTRRKVRHVVQEPLHPPLKSRQARNGFRLERLDGK